MKQKTNKLKQPVTALIDLLKSESGGGIVLMVTAAVALIVANSPLASIYFEMLHQYVGGLSVLHWINDGLMAIFFLLVGMEIKREFLVGELATWPLRILPGFAAAGGMIVPALIYVAFNYTNPETMSGWAIPTATDIAFALAVLAMMGSRIPFSLKVFLMALAIIDDLGAVAIIAAFYTDTISIVPLAGCVAVFALLVGLNLAKITRLSIYLLLGIALWFLMLKSGVHATIAGVLLAMTIPLRNTQGQAAEGASPLLHLEHMLTPWVAFLIVPLFGFANAGVSFTDISLSNFLDPVPLGVAAGLFFGKQIGVFSCVWTAIKLKLCERPKDASMMQLYGVSLLCGIGFTMSLFIGLLSFSSQALQDEVKMGVLAGSLLSALVGMFVLWLAAPKKS